MDLQGFSVVGRVYVSTTSGKVTAEDVTANTVSFGSTSGKLSFNSSCREFQAETVSGTVSLTLPKECAFELEFDTVSGTLDCDFPVSMRDGAYISGSGGAEIDVDTVSGSLKLYAQ